MKRETRYWDSTCFLCWLKDEPEKEACDGVVEAAQRGEVLIVTSTLTLAEVIKLRHHACVSSKDAEQVKEFFERYDIIEVRGLDRRTAEDARQLVWDHGVNPKDAIHLATALRYHIPIFDTLDVPLIKLDGRLGNPPLRIGKPEIAFQTAMFGTNVRKIGTIRKKILFKKFEPITYRENIIYRKFGPLS